MPGLIDGKCNNTFEQKTISNLLKIFIRKRKKYFVVQKKVFWIVFEPIFCEFYIRILLHQNP